MNWYLYIRVLTTVFMVMLMAMLIIVVYLKAASNETDGQLDDYSLAECIILGGGTVIFMLIDIYISISTKEFRDDQLRRSLINEI